MKNPSDPIKRTVSARAEQSKPARQKPVGSGRKTRWSDSTEKIFLAAMGDGVSLKDACRIAGVDFDSFQRRRIANPQFGERVRDTVAINTRSMIVVIRDAARAGDWRAAEKWLMLTRADEYSQRARVEIGGSQDASAPPIRVQMDVDAELAERLRASREGRRTHTDDLYAAAGKPNPYEGANAIRRPESGLGLTEPGRILASDGRGDVVAGTAPRRG